MKFRKATAALAAASLCYSGAAIGKEPNGRWTCHPNSGASFLVFDITNHRVDSAMIAKGEAAWGFAEIADYHVLSEQWDRSRSGKVHIGLGCAATAPDCSGYERIAIWSFDFDEDVRFDYFPNESTGKSGLFPFSEKSGQYLGYCDRVDLNSKVPNMSNRKRVTQRRAGTHPH